jgi:phenol 2-monooxygenase (NADPH)
METENHSPQHFESQIVVCIADAHPVHLGDRLLSDGRWRLIIFAGKLTRHAQRARYEKLCAELGTTKSPVTLYQVGKDIDNFIEVLTVISSERSAINLTEYPDIARPACGPHGYRKYNTIFADEVSYHDGGGRAYQGYGVDPDGPGTVILIRASPRLSGLLV